MNITGHNGLNKSADQIDWDHVRFFSPSEFQGELKNLDAAVVYVLDKLREKVGRIMISPANGAITRNRAGSMHDITGGKLSKAIDIMPLEVSLKEFYQAARKIDAIGGIGLYPDWLPYAGAHIDLRVRKNNKDLFEWGGLKVAAGQKYVSINEVLNA